MLCLYIDAESPTSTSQCTPLIDSRTRLHFFFSSTGNISATGIVTTLLNTASDINRCQFEDKGHSAEVVYCSFDQDFDSPEHEAVCSWKRESERKRERESLTSAAGVDEASLVT